MKKLGILGGMGPLATADLFKRVVLSTKAQKDQDHLSIYIDNNTAIPDRTAFLLGKGEDPLPELIKSAQNLQKMGADFLIMPCNTAHSFYHDIVKSIQIPFLHMVEETVSFIKNNNPSLKKIGLLSTKGTIESRVYHHFAELQNLEIVLPSESDSQVMMDVIYGIKQGKTIDNDFVKPFDKVTENVALNGVEVFILGCTELSVLADSYPLKGKFVDPLTIIAKKAVLFAGGEIV